MLTVGMPLACLPYNALAPAAIIGRVPYRRATKGGVSPLYYLLVDGRRRPRDDAPGSAEK